MSHKQLIDDVKASRRTISKISHSCQGDPDIIAMFDGGLEITVTTREAEQLLNASKSSQTADLSFDDLVAALNGEK